MNEQKLEIAKLTNKDQKKGSLEEMLAGADVFIGVSAAGALKKEWIAHMNPQPMILGLANPVPEIFPQEAIEAGAFIVGTGRSDFPNQVNNSLAFPGNYIFLQRRVIDN